jgi:NAD+ kinase
VAVIALTLHHARPEAAQLGVDLVRWLADQGHEVVVPGDDAPLLGADAAVVAVGPDRLASAAMVVALGGDGTVLRSVDLLAGAAVPVVGVNLGQLGYLTEVEPTEVRNAIDGVLAGRHDVERRMMLEVVVEATGQRFLALNEVTLDRTVSGHTVRIDVAIDGQGFTPYEVDALIVATPTGSTAYALSAGGPIVAPTHRCLLLTPVSPHMLFDRSLVLEASSTVELTVGGHRGAVLCVDGRDEGVISPGGVVRCRAAAEEAILAVFGRRNFPGLLKAKFKLGDR